MLLKKYIKSRRKCKILLLVLVLVLIVITLLLLGASKSVGGAGAASERLLDERFIARAYGNAKLEQPPLLKSPKENGVIVPEKYDEQKIKARIMHDKLEHLKNHNAIAAEPGEEHTTLQSISNAIHIFYSAPVQWYKGKKSSRQQAEQRPVRELISEDNETVPTSTTPKPPRILNSAFYPALGLYKPTPRLLQQHFENIRNCGVGVLILSYSGKVGEFELYNQILDLAPGHNLSVTFEISVAGNQSVEYLRQQLRAVRKFSTAESFYRVYSQAQGKWVPLVYVSNAYKLGDTASRMLCPTQTDNLRRIMDAYYIGHIRLKNHAETLRRLCFEGFYSKLPSNGATFASTWKNWSYLKSFALTYKMLFIPTVGPGFAERNKFPRHGDIQRHRSNGRYYGVAWRTAILNNVGFINIASYNNWPDGSQIEEVIPKAGFLDYSPGTKTKYLDLTTHWVGNFMKSRREAAEGGGQGNCYELLNNTIC